MQSQEFLDIGRHCKEPSCNQLDFLPFKCPSCRLDFCSEHWRPPAGHRCSNYNEAKADIRIPTCPLCSQPIPFPPSHDPNAAMDAHLSTSCPVLLPDRALAASGHSSKKSPNQCSAPSCKTKMIVPIECEGCHHKFCPSHRWKSDHACSSISASSSSSGASSRSQSARKKTLGGIFGRSSTAASSSSVNGTGSRTPGAAGLAALRRAQQSRIDKHSTAQVKASTPSAAVPSHAPTLASKHLTPTFASPGAVESDSDVEIVSFKPATSQNKTAAAAAGQKALASVGVASKTDKRARAEQESKRKALEARAKKGLLTETEKLQYATLQALAQREGKDGGDASCVVG
ncbi:hypothetical protein JCM10908_006981 [Rhodotorula pacifica]|uniref:AN1-type zinc finger protein n=1 Tax=Rhodotorula pacifica TaxID=1495444 RepID=UPI00316D6B20